MALMAMALQFLNVPAISLNAFQVKMHSTARNGNARFKRVDTDRITHELENRKVVIVTGFQGINKYEDITTLEEVDPIRQLWHLRLQCMQTNARFIQT